MGLIRILRLSRPHALAAIAFILVGVQCGLIEPAFEQAGVANPFTTSDFILVLLAEVLIAAGGFVINGYFDLRADLITKPQRIIVGRDVSPRTAESRWLPPYSRLYPPGTRGDCCCACFSR